MFPLVRVYPIVISVHLRLADRNDLQSFGSDRTLGSINWLLLGQAPVNPRKPSARVTGQDKGTEPLKCRISPHLTGVPFLQRVTCVLCSVRLRLFTPLTPSDATRSPTGSSCCSGFSSDLACQWRSWRRPATSRTPRRAHRSRPTTISMVLGAVDDSAASTDSLHRFCEYTLSAVGTNSSQQALAVLCC